MHIQVLLYGNTRPPAQNTQIHDTKNYKTWKSILCPKRKK